MATLPLILGSIFGNALSGIFGAKASNNAANQQVQAGNDALDFQKQVYSDQKGNQQPFISAGQTSIGQLMQGLQSGQFGLGSTGEVPQYSGHFEAPTLEEARNSPGYQFASQQGTAGILKGASAAGGAISGGTLKALGTFETGLADSTYNNVFNRSLSTYNTGLQDYGAKLQGYDSGLAGKQQEFNQTFAPAALGEQAAQGVNASGSQAATNIGGLMTDIGRVKAGGTVGSANAVNGAISGGFNDVLQSIIASKFLGKTAGPG